MVTVTPWNCASDEHAEDHYRKESDGRGNTCEEKYQESCNATNFLARNYSCKMRPRQNEGASKGLGFVH